MSLVLQMRDGRGTGFLPDWPELVEHENRTRPLLGFDEPADGARPLLTGSPPRPAAVSWASKLDTILDQGATNSCVGCGLSTAIFLRGQLSTPCARPSAKAIYDGARLVFQTDAIVDEGCRAQWAIAKASQHGLVPWEDWPLFTDDPALLELRPTPETSWINTPPPFDLYHKAIDASITGYHRADTGDVVAALELALSVGHIPVYAQYMRDDYSDVRDEVYDVPNPDRVTDGNGASHLQVICGYDEVSFHVVSSWGYGHGVRGIVRVAKRVIAGAYSFNRIVITQVPRGYRA